MMKYKVKKTANLLETIMELYHGVSRQKAKQIITNSLFTKNGQPLANHPKEVLEAGDLLEVLKPDNQVKKVTLPKRSQPFALYFEDEHLVVGIKPAGILSVADQNHPKEKSYHKMLEQYLANRDEEKTRLWVVHRMDRELEGLMLFAKSENIQQKMVENWSKTTIKLTALTEGRPEENKGTIENWLLESDLRTLVPASKDHPEAHRAKTAWQYIRPEGANHVLEVQVIEGRNKQIRAHLSGLGCPIVGDRKYGADGGVLRQIRLSANRMEFDHPTSGKRTTLSYQPAKFFFAPTGGANEQYKIM